jgi:hypothetical protein
MPGFLRRFTSIPTLEVIKQIEGPVIIDLAPPDPATGQGTGTVLLVGEFDDGYFASDTAIKGALEVFGGEDYRQKFGSLGYDYAGVPSNNPCARRRLFELWNGNGWIKSFKLKAQRLLISRVDTSVGVVSFDPLATIAGKVGPYVLAVGQTLSITTNSGTGASAALTAVVATVVGATQAFASIVSGDTFGIKIDGSVQVNVTFGGADTTQAAVIARINATLGFACAIAATTEVNLRGIIAGTAGRVELIEVTTGVLAKLGHAAGVTSGTGTFGNILAVTATELAAYVNASAAITTVNGQATVGPDGELRVYNDVPGAVSTILVTAGAMATAIAFTTIGTAVGAGAHPGGRIPAGTRVRNGSAVEFVTMQTLDVPAGSLGPILAKVRHAIDDGTGLTTAAASVTVLVDAPSFANFAINNAAALTAALTEPQMDVAYKAALDRTLDESGVCREANYLLIARRSDQVVRDGRANALRATECGLFARKFVTGDPLGTSIAQIAANVANFRSDRVFYTGKGMRVTVPNIAARGTAGGTGFTADGTITVRPDGPLTTICAMRPPEENPGQQTNLIDDFFEVDGSGEVLEIEAYKAFKAAGVCVPKLERGEGMTFQSGVTSSLESGRTTCSRRKMADFIQDTHAEVTRRYAKTLNKQAQRDAVRTDLETFLDGLLSSEDPDKSRIEGYTLDDGVTAGNTSAVRAQNVHFVKSVVRTLGTMDNIVSQTEIGTNANITREL